MYKLKTMFTPLAPTTSTSSSPSPSPLTSPLDDGITTVKYYIYIHTQKPRTNATTKKYYFNWQENIKCNSHCIYTSTCPYRCCPEMCVDTAAETIATHREAKLVFMQGLVKRILREAYREPTTPPSVGTPLAQSVFAGVPPPNRPTPYFVTQPNYHDGQFYQYYTPENQSPVSQSPATSVHTISPHSTGMNTTQTSVTSTTSLTSTTPSTTAHCSSHATVSREAYRTLTLFAPIALVESLTKTNHFLVADMKGELQSINNQLSHIPIEEIRKEQAQAFEMVNERMEALEKNFNELKDIVMIRTNQSFKMDPKLLEQWNPTMLGD